MAQLLEAPALETGITTGKFVLVRISDGQFWSTAGTPAFEAYNASNIADYGIAATEVGSTGIYKATNPADTTASRVVFVKAAGSSLAVTDLVSNVYYDDRAGPELAGGTTPPTTAEIADKVLGRSVQGGADGGLTVSKYLQGEVNKFTISEDGTTLTIYDYTGIAVLQTVDLTRLSTSIGGVRTGTPE